MCGTAADTCSPEYYLWVRDTQHLRVPLCICFRCAQRSCPGPSAGPLKNMAHDSGQPGLLDAKADAKNITVTTWLNIITIVCSECEHVFIFIQPFCQPDRRHICIENVGLMGKEPADTFLPHRADYRTVAVLHMSDVLLTWMVGGLGCISDCLHRAFYHQCFLRVVSLQVANQRLTSFYAQFHRLLLWSLKVSANIKSQRAPSSMRGFYLPRFFSYWY